MRRMPPVLTGLLVVILVCGGGCNRSDQGGLPLLRPSPVFAPAPPPEPPPPPPPVRVIALGEEVTATYAGADVAFELTAPASGTLVATLSWDAWGTDSLLELVIDGIRFRFTEPDFSPIVGRASVTAGTRSSLVVELAGTGMEVDVPFVLKTWME